MRISVSSIYNLYILSIVNHVASVVEALAGFSFSASLVFSASRACRIISSRRALAVFCFDLGAAASATILRIEESVKLSKLVLSMECLVTVRVLFAPRPIRRVRWTWRWRQWWVNPAAIDQMRKQKLCIRERKDLCSVVQYDIRNSRLLENVIDHLS